MIVCKSPAEIQVVILVGHLEWNTKLELAVPDRLWVEVRE